MTIDFWVIARAVIPGFLLLMFIMAAVLILVDLRRIVFFRQERRIRHSNFSGVIDDFIVHFVIAGWGMVAFSAGYIVPVFTTPVIGDVASLGGILLFGLWVIITLLYDIPRLTFYGIILPVVLSTWSFMFYLFIKGRRVYSLVLVRWDLRRKSKKIEPA